MTNDAITQLVAKASEYFEKANAIASKVAKSQGSVAKDIKEARENSDDPTVVEFREWYDLALAKINDETEKINKYIVDNGIVEGAETMSEDEVSKAKDEHKDLKKNGNEAWSAAETVAKLLGEDMPEKPEVLTLTGKASAGGTGTGGRRLRFARVEVNGEEVKNLSAVALKIKSKSGKDVRAADLQKALFEYVGTDDMSKINDTTFGWSETDSDGNTHSFDITVYPKHDETVTEATEDETDESEDTETEDTESE